MDDLPTLSNSKLVHQGYFDLRIDTLARKNGTAGCYTVLLTKVNATAILTEDTKGRLILTREYRHPIQQYVLSCPGGRIEPSEDSVAAARRELLEETGYVATKFHFLANYFPLPSICDQKISLFFAKGAKKTCRQKLDPLEVIELVIFKKEELLQEIRRGALIDGVLSAALFYKGLLE